MELRTMKFGGPNGEELISAPRVRGYIKNLAPGIEVLCPSAEDDLYTSPTDANNPPPWKYGDGIARPEWSEFLGILPSSSTGLWGSTQEGVVTELKHDGGVPGLRRHRSREIRVVANLYALTERGLQYGLDWLTDAISGGYCPSTDMNCTGAELAFLPELGDTTTDSDWRLLLDVKILSGVKVVEHMRFKKIKGLRVEFILIAGNPFIYHADPAHTLTIQSQSLTDAAEVACDPEQEAYDSLITDPALGDVVRPPRPPSAEPITMPSSWKRRSAFVPMDVLQHPGQSVFVTDVEAGTEELRLLRVRFYTEPTAPCSYEGEFLIIYLPAGSTLHIDGMRESISLTLQNGRTVPAGNLVIGSNGRPASWPVLDCRLPVTVHVEYPTVPNTAMSVTTDARIRR